MHLLQVVLETTLLAVRSVTTVTGIRALVGMAPVVDLEVVGVTKSLSATLPIALVLAITCK